MDVIYLYIAFNVVLMKTGKYINMNILMFTQYSHTHVYKMQYEVRKID